MATVGDIFQRKIYQIFKDLPNVFGIAYDMLAAGYDENCRDHDNTLQRVFLMYRELSQKIKINVISGIHQSHFWWDHCVRPDPRN